MPLGQERGTLGITEHERESLRRVFGIERHIRGSRLEIAKMPITISSERSTEIATRVSAPTPCFRRKWASRLARAFRSRSRALVLEHDRDGIRRPLDLVLDEAVQTPVARKCPERVIPLLRGFLFFLSP